MKQKCSHLMKNHKIPVLLLLSQCHLQTDRDHLQKHQRNHKNCFDCPCSTLCDMLIDTRKVFSVPVCSSLWGNGEFKPLSTLAVSAGGQDGSERNTDTRRINESSRHETTWPCKKKPEYQQQCKQTANNLVMPLYKTSSEKTAFLILCSTLIHYFWTELQFYFLPPLAALSRSGTLHSRYYVKFDF